MYENLYEIATSWWATSSSWYGEQQLIRRTPNYFVRRSRICRCLKTIQRRFRKMNWRRFRRRCLKHSFKTPAKYSTKTRCISFKRQQSYQSEITDQYTSRRKSHILNRARNLGMYKNRKFYFQFNKTFSEDELRPQF